MKYKPHKQYRLPYYNYASSGMYFVTICTENRKELFGTVKNGEMMLSDYGSMAYECLVNIPSKWNFVHLDEFIVMPNHVHIIIVIENPNQERSIAEKKFRPEENSLSFVIRNFKSTVTLLVRKLNPGVDVWQSRFYDRIIRGENELQRIRTYIQNNPMQWEADKNNPENLLL